MSFVILTSVNAAKLYNDEFFTPLSNRIGTAQKECEEIYKDLLKQYYLPDDLDLGTAKMGNHIVRNGTILLNLIDWLDKNKKNDPIGLLFLRKLNRYLYLQFRSFISHLKIYGKDRGRLVGFLHDIYKFKVPGCVGTAECKLKFAHPFQAALSKTILFILILNASDIAYEKKAENLAYFLDKIRRELLDVRSQHESCSLSAEDIEHFIELLESYAAKGSIISSDHLKPLIIILAAAGIVLLIAWLYWDKNTHTFGSDAVAMKCRATLELLGYIGEYLSGRSGRGFARGALNEVRDSRACIVPGYPIVPEHSPDPYPDSSDSAEGDSSDKPILDEAAVGTFAQEHPWLAWGLRLVS
jgi:hypothetical protein